MSRPSKASKNLNPVPLPKTPATNGHEPEEGGRNVTVPPVLAPAFKGILPQAGSSEEVMEEWSPLRDLLDPGPGRETLDVRTDVNSLQIIQLSRGRVFAQRHNIPVLHDFIDSMLRLSLSKNRKSRKEFVSAFQSSHTSDSEHAASILSKLRQ